jgi:hypothetical protein
MRLNIKAHTASIAALLLSSASFLSASTILELDINKENQSKYKANQAAEFDTNNILVFEKQQHLTLPEETYAKIPLDNFSVTARVRIDKPLNDGGIIGRFQDNGNYERGWLLGYNGSKFSFQFSNGESMVRVVAPQEAILGQTYNLSATYDGKNAHLFINGKKVASAKAKGKIANPDIPSEFVIGAYKDQNELYPLEGRIESIGLFDHILTPAELSKHKDPTEITFAVRPSVSFVAPGQALVRWESTHAGSGAINFGTTSDLGTILKSDSKTTNHSVLLTGLSSKTEYHYRIATTSNGNRQMSPPFTFDTTMNYMAVQAPDFDALAPTQTEQKAIEHILSKHGKHFSGHALVLGGKDGKLAYALAKNTRLKVTIIEKSAERAQALRNALYPTGVYGTRVSVMHVPGSKIPLGSCVANLIVSEHTLAGKTLPYSKDEAKRLTRPDGGQIITKKLVYTRPKLKGATDWTHQYGTAANTSYTAEELGEIDNTGDTTLQWIGRPGADFGIDRQNKISSPLAVQGRTYLQGLNRVIGLDAYNGEILWSKEIPDLRRMNVPHDSANWCADENNVYLAGADRAWVIDGKSGERIGNLKLTAQKRDTHDWGYIATNDYAIIGTSVLKGSHVRDFWGRDKWYDKAGQKKSISQVCSDKIFGYSKKDLKGRWAYGQGRIVNATISIQDDKIYFIENRNPDIQADAAGRVSDNRLWIDDAFVVCISSRNGKKLWESQMPNFEHLTESSGFLQTVYGQVSNNGFLVVASEAIFTDNKYTRKGRYAYVQFDERGKVKWRQTTPWSSDHHGSHIVHPVVFEDSIYCYPHAVDADTGKVLTQKMSGRSGCPTIVGFKNGIFQRAHSPTSKGSLTIWSKKTQKNSGWAKLRPSCWLNFLPSQGLTIMSEGGGGCSCGGWIETSVALIPTSHTN